MCFSGLAAEVTLGDSDKARIQCWTCPRRIPPRREKTVPATEWQGRLSEASGGGRCNRRLSADHSRVMTFSGLAAEVADGKSN